MVGACVYIIHVMSQSWRNGGLCQPYIESGGLPPHLRCHCIFLLVDVCIVMWDAGVICDEDVMGDSITCGSICHESAHLNRLVHSFCFREREVKKTHQYMHYWKYSYRRCL